MPKTKSSKSSKKDKKSKKSKKSDQIPKVNFYCGTNYFSLPNGDEYVGDYCAHRNGIIWREGHGIYHTKDNQTYEGLWYADKLVDGTQISITYDNGSVYKGTLSKNKYQGAGTYTLQNGLPISGYFENNKLKGDVKLIDFDGRLWHGIAKENQVVLTPENFFYQNINDVRGKSKRILKEIDPLSHITSDPEVFKLPPTILSSLSLKRRVFAKSTKTDDFTKTDFTNSPWYKKYLAYKEKREYILNKFKNHERLTKEEYKWYANWARCRKLAKVRKYPVANERPVDTSLLQTFLGDDFKGSCKPVKVYYPTYDWHDKLEEEEEYEEPVWNIKDESYPDMSYVSLEESIEEETEPIIEIVPSEHKIEVGVSVGIGTDSLCDYIKAISLNKDVRAR